MTVERNKPPSQDSISLLASCFTNSYSLTGMRQRLDEAEERCYDGTEGPRKKEEYCILLRAEERRGERKETSLGELFH